MNARTVVYLRGDGDKKIGLGHVHRLLSLSEMLKDNFECRFIIRSPLPGIRELIKKTCSQLLEINNSSIEDNEILSFLTGKEIVVLDGYNFNTTYQKNIKNRESTLVCIDDIHECHFVADAVINPAGGVRDQYSAESYTSLFLGPAYAMLKKPFLETSKKGKIRNSADSIFICMGGADPLNITFSTLLKCVDSPFSTYYVVIGEAYSHREELENTIKTLKGKIELLSSLHPTELAEIMCRCSVAVCSASGIAYEYLSCGGELYLRQTASNQSDLYNYMIDDSLAFDFKDFRTNEDEVTKSIKKQKIIFDGNSGARVLKIFNRLDFKLHVTIRKASEHDVQLTFQWANDSATRAQSFNSNTISFEDHEEWFGKKIVDHSTLYYIVEYKGVPVGQVRFQVEQEAVINYLIDINFRGRGWGQLLLQHAINAFRSERTDPIIISGFVKKSNSGSTAIFRNLGFIELETTEYPDSFKYELKKV